MNHCLTCRQFLSKEKVRCEPCARKFAERIHAYKANTARRQQLEEMEGTLVLEGYEPPTPKPFTPVKLTASQALRLVKGIIIKEVLALRP